MVVLTNGRAKSFGGVTKCGAIIKALRAAFTFIINENPFWFFHHGNVVANQSVDRLEMYTGPWWP